MATALEDAAKLIKSGWKPPQEWHDFTRQRALQFFGPVDLTSENIDNAGASGESQPAPVESTPLDRAPAGPPREAIRAVTRGEHIDELCAELRGSLDSRERNMIATELDVARAALKDHVIEGALRPEVMPNQLAAMSTASPRKAAESRGVSGASAGWRFEKWEAGILAGAWNSISTSRQQR